MKQCALCAKKAGFFSKKVTAGYICSDCRRYIPSVLLYAEKDALLDIINENKKREQDFNCTAFFGSLYIDGVHNMFCVSKTGVLGKPTSFDYIYYITELLEVGIYCANVKVYNNKVYADIKFKMKTHETEKEFTIKSHVFCYCRIKGDKIEWKEPPELSMFRNMFNQMIDNVLLKVSEKLKYIQLAQKEISEDAYEKRWAEGILYLPKNYKPEDIRKHRNFLIKKLHPDCSDAENEYAEQINAAYEKLAK